MERSGHGDVQSICVLLPRTSSGQMGLERPRSLALGASEIVASLIHSSPRSSGTRTESYENEALQANKAGDKWRLHCGPAGPAKATLAAIDLTVGKEVAASKSKEKKEKTRSASY